MTARPLELPLVATDSTVLTGVEAGLSVRLKPSAGLRAQGKLYDVPTAARHQNWLEGLTGDWIAHFDELITDRALDGFFAGMSLPSVNSDSIVYDDVHRTWVVANTGASPAAKVSYNGCRTGVSSTVGTAGTPNADGILAAGNGVILLSYGTTSSTASRITRSTDGGLTFSTVALPAAGTGIVKVFWTGTKFLATAAANCWSSPDGITWTAVTAFPGVGGIVADFGWATNGSVFLGSPGGADLAYSTSNDGGSWQAMTLLPGTSPFLRGTAYDKQRNTWFAAGNINPGTETPRVWSSTDLVNWTAITPQFPVLPNGYAKTRLRGLAYFRGALVSVVNDSGGGQWIVISKDGGTTWQHVTESTGSDVRIVTASDESSVAVLTVNAGAAALQITPRISL